MKKRSTDDEYNEITKSFMENIENIKKVNDMNSYEKLTSMIHIQSIHFIKIMNMEENAESATKLNFLFDYSTELRIFLHTEYYRMIDECIKENLIKSSIDKNQLYETIQNMIVYFNLSYYRGKRIGSSLEYLEEAVHLLFEGLKK